MSQPASAPRIATIVEGHGEVEAVPVLIRRIAEEIMPAAWPTILRPYRVGRDALLRGQGVETEVDNLLRRHGDVAGLLVLFDADDDCRATIGPDLTFRLRTARPDLPTAVVLPTREFEAWFVAAAPSSASRQGFAADLAAPAHPETIRGCKEWLSRHRPGGMPYKPRQHQPALAAVFDPTTARAHAPFFAKFCRDVERLLTTTARPQGGTS